MCIHSVLVTIIGTHGISTYNEKYLLKVKNANLVKQLWSFDNS